VNAESEGDGVWQTPIGRLRMIGYVEGASFLILLAVMPLKYLAQIPEPVRVVGWAHGVLFLLYVAAVALAHRAGRLPTRLAGWALAASVLPAGPFVLDGRLRHLEPPAASGPSDGTG
jgi:integral membrane protein